MSQSERTPLQRWIARRVGWFGLLAMVAVIASAFGGRRMLPGLLGGTLAAFFTSAGALALSYVERAHPTWSRSRRVLDLSVSLSTGTFFVLLVLMGFGAYVWSAWWGAADPDRSWWFQPWFFLVRVVVYFVLLTGAVVAHGKLAKLNERILLAPLLMVLVTFDMLVGPAPFWIATLLWVPLICAGAASGGAFAIVMTRLLHRCGELDDAGAIGARLAKSTLRAALIALVAFGAVIGLAFFIDELAPFRALVEGDVRVVTFASVGAITIAIGVLAAGRLVAGATAVLLGYLGLAVAIIVPDPSDGFSLVGVLGGVLGPLFGLAGKLGAKTPAAS